MGRWCAQGCLLVLLVSLPWSFGGVDPFSQTAIFPLLLLAVLGAGWAGLWEQSDGTRRPWSAWPGALLVVLGGLQTWDLGPGALAWISPHTAAVRAELLSGSGPDIDGVPIASTDSLSIDSTSVPTPATLSVDPPATRREVALLFAGLTTYVLAMRCFTARKERQLLAGVVAVNGVAIAYFGIVQMLSWNGEMYWSVPIEGTTPYGPFVNRNSGGGYQVMTFAACGYLICGFLSSSERDPLQWQNVRRELWQAWLPPRHVCLWSCLAALVVIVAGVAASLSRGAWLGGVIGLVTVVACLPPQRLRAQTIVGLCGVMIAAAAFLAWLSLTDAIRDRLPESKEQVDLGGRLELWQDVLRMVPDYWQTGSGLGTFGLVQPMYQQRPMTIWFDQAENLFLQSLVEGGVVALFCLMALTFCAFATLITTARTTGRTWTTEERAMLAMGLFVIGSQVVCASFDFGLRYPANQFTLAVLVGAALGSVSARTRSAIPEAATRRGRIAFLLTHAAWVMLLGFAWRDMAWSGGLELALNRGDQRAALNALAESEIDELQSAMSILLAAQPAHAEGQLRVAELEVQRYRRAALAELQSETETTAAFSEEELWSYTSLATLRRQALEAARAGDVALLAELRQQPLIHAHLRSAEHLARQARAAGPFHFRIHQLLAELAFLRGDPREMSADVAHAIRLVPQHPDVRFWAGELEWQAGRIDTGCLHWQRCLELTANYDREICAVATSQIPQAIWIRDVLPNNASVLCRLLDAGALSAISEDFAEQLSQKCLAAATASPATSSTVAQPEQLAVEAYGLELIGQAPESLAKLRQAVALAPERTTWRLRLADQLQQQGLTVEAVREAEVAMRIDPASSAAKLKLAELLQSPNP